MTATSSRLISYSLWLLGIWVLISFWSMNLPGASAGTFNPETINTWDTAWMLISTALVMLMTPAVWFFYGGMVSSKNIVSVLKQSILILSIVSIQWVLFGYSLVFGTDVWGIIGGMNFFWLRGVGFAPNADYAATIPHLAFMMFQGMFAIVTPALIIWAIVERINLKALIIFVLFWTTLVYDPIAHWVWGVGGWLRVYGALDFAGGTVVHMSAWFSALAAAMLVGKRINQGHPGNIANNLPFIILWAALLWFGWFGFNAGSAVASGALAASAFVVTNTAAAAAALAWMFLSWAETGKPSAMAAAIGAVCGLVVITPASWYVGPLSSVAMGLIGGVLTYMSVYLRTKKIKIDDTLDVWAAHGMGGLFGALLTWVFAEKAINSAGADGALFGNPHLLIIQLWTVCVTWLYAFFATIILLKVIGLFMPLRVSSSDEKEGLDMATHGEVGFRF